MKKVKAFIEIGNDKTYGVYVDLDDNTLNYGIHGDGSTVREAVDDFLNSYQEMKEYYKEIKKKFIEVEFDFHYDVASFLAYYGNVITLAGLERLTGVNRGQLSHYVTGRNKPTKKTTEKIQAALHKFGKELSQIAFV